MTELPDFDLAVLTRLPPDTFKSDAPDIDAFVLAFALAFNDLKDLEYFLHQLGKGEPASFRVDAYCGQFYGVKIHLTRLMLAFQHELLHAIKVANDLGILRHHQFATPISGMKPEAPADPRFYRGETVADSGTLLDSRHEWTNDFDTSSLGATSRADSALSVAKSATRPATRTPCHAACHAEIDGL